MDGVITIKNSEYPKLLKEIGKEAPKQLYYKGKWDKEIFENCLAVVGSRRMTSYGRRMTEQLVTEIAAAGITIVSGFMYGGDEAAHRAALTAGGRTIAVMPCGIDRIHPEFQEELYNEILKKGGLILSEFEADFPPDTWTYPKRNRIVAGLSKTVLIVEAGLKSGTLITADYAKKFKRKIFCVPGPLTSEVSKGTAQLLKEGAEVATGAKDILDFYKKNSNFQTNNEIKSLSSRANFVAGQGKAKSDKPEEDSLENKIIEKLSIEPMGIDDLVVSLGVPSSKLGSIISLMELKGLVEEEGGRYHVN